MLKVILTDKLSDKIPEKYFSGKVISTRKLSRSEINFVRKHGMKRLYLSSLGAAETKQFLKEFDSKLN